MNTNVRDRLPSLSLCMIVRDEEQTLGPCLASIAGLVKEIVVVDTGSTDGTEAVATAHGATIVHHPWNNDFSSARNAGLERATGDWILVLDADEELMPQSRRLLGGLLAGTAAEGYQLRQRSVMPSGDLQRYEDLLLTRLFRNRPEHRYEQPIHEQIRPAIERAGGTVRESNLTILHHGFSRITVQGRDHRAMRNLSILKSAADSSPGDSYLHFQLGVTYKALGDQTAARASLLHALSLDCRGLGDAIMEKLFMKLSQLALASGDFSQAVRYAGESLARNRKNVVSLYVLALSYLFQGNIRDAYPNLKRLRGLPSDSLSPQHDLDAVIQYCRQVLEDGNGRDLATRQSQLESRKGPAPTRLVTDSAGKRA